MDGMMLPDRIAKELSALIGMPLWGVLRALNMEVFAFGEQFSEVNQTGEEVEYGEFSLHVQCPWRVVGPDGIIVVGSQDRFYPEDDETDPEEHDSAGPSRCEERMSAWLRKHAETPLKVERAEADHTGGFRLHLDQGYVLEAFPADSLHGERYRLYSERWRLLRMTSPNRNVVITGDGIEWVD